ncbi:HD-GYP domain-containing protein (c-di-GMP phosphodiesterase class II) [Cytobacillus eiseniae]|uniref:HD-GYP domain-containing protein (C-di-GMP phosphodiesterase class II) n=1 Tax=Cytobacillus eiseniae TaxID=762947 RepID=A0ABS4RJS6_9BACI|nr:HD domain-containing phosphohydrolase [Cytobacillus eiseniae]MBP2243138.1 HD-GYP domain-containing protein (c-di-GMP phosphodiesterase class II) [Cytobacillus eiseniae]
MRVKANELKEGCIITEDIFSLTNRPIISKKTIVTNDLIEILKAFLIKEVTIDKLMINGTPFNPIETLDDSESGQSYGINLDDSSLENHFLMSVQEYKREFKNWQSGLAIDISKIRNIMIPLIEKSEKNPSEIFSLHHLSTQEEYIFQHAVAVGVISAFIGKKLKMSKGDIIQLAIGGSLSDAGMAKVKPTILNKKSTLTKQEFDEIKRHTTYSYKMVQNISLLKDSTKIGILQHHERLDGSGYPLGDKNNKINIIAKIIGAADTFHAMSCNRLYRRKQSPFKVLEMMLEDMFGKYDITAIQAIGSAIMTFSIGGTVKLSDDRIAEILFIEESSPTRPLVKIKETGEMIHLLRNRQLFIDEVIK